MTKICEDEEDIDEEEEKTIKAIWLKTLNYIKMVHELLMKLNLKIF